jgi:hypothetical protein
MMSFIVMNLARFGRDRERSLLFVLFYSLRKVYQTFQNMRVWTGTNGVHEDFTRLYPAAEKVA